eukprot:2989585-Prymnesium_polylepis.1
MVYRLKPPWPRRARGLARTGSHVTKKYRKGEFRSVMAHVRRNRPAVCGGRRRGASFQHSFPTNQPS